MRSAAYRGRFAPSPTGPLHFGSLVAAVASYLDAKSHQGEWLLRIEDVDPLREVKGIIPAQIQCLEQLGFKWDGEIRNQSDHTDSYRTAVETLLKNKTAYYCRCSRREIANAAVKGKEGWLYPGTCRQRQVHDGIPSSVRFNVGNLKIEFTDALQGQVYDDLAQDYGDFVIQRADTHFAYLLAVVIDDAEQGITNVVRGIDLLSTTSRQIALQRALKLPPVSYAHFLTATHPDGKKLSKQTHAPSIHPIVDDGGGRSLLIAALTFLKQNPPDKLNHLPISEIWGWAIDHWTNQALAWEKNRVVPVTLATAQ